MAQVGNIILKLETRFLFGRSKAGVLFAALLMKCGVPASWLIRVKVPEIKAGK